MSPCSATPWQRPGLNPYLFEWPTFGIECSWVHMHEPEKPPRNPKTWSGWRLPRRGYCSHFAGRPSEKKIFSLSLSRLQNSANNQRRFFYSDRLPAKWLQ